MRGLKKFLIISLAIILVIQFFCVGLLPSSQKAKADGATPIFTDDFSSTSGNGAGTTGKWDPVSGAWQVDEANNTYQQKNTGAGSQDTEVVYSNDFSQSLNLNIVRGSSSHYVLSDGHIQLTDAGATGGKTKAIMPYTDAVNWKNYTIDLDFYKVPANSGYILVYFRSDALGTTATKNYAFFLSATSITLYQDAGQATQPNMGAKTWPSLTDAWHHLKVSVVGMMVYTYLDGSDTFFTSNNLADNPETGGYTTGTVGIGKGSTEGTPLLVDNFEVKTRPIKANPPIVYYNSESSEKNTTTDLSFYGQDLSAASIQIQSPGGATSNYEGVVAEGTTMLDLTFPEDFGLDSLSYGTYLVQANIDEQSFTTLLEVKPPPDFTFAQFTDSHSQYTAINSFVDKINGRDYFPKPDAVVGTGDLVNQDAGVRLPVVKNSLDNLDGVPYYTTIGNHDTQDVNGDEEGVPGTAYNTIFSDKFDYYQPFDTNGDDIDDYILIFLKSCSVDFSETGFGQEDPAAWIDGVLDEYSNQKAFVFSHCSLTSENPRDVLAVPGSGYTCSLNSPDYGNAIMSVLENHPNVVATAAGHSHLNNIYDPADYDNIINFMTSSLYGSGEFRYFEVYADGHIDSAIYNTYSDSITPEYALYDGDTNADHLNNVDYQMGLPAERNVEFNSNQSSVKVVPKHNITLGTGSTGWKNYEVGATVNIDGAYMPSGVYEGVNEAGLIGRYINEDNYYYAALDTNTSDVVNHINLYKKVNGEYSLVDSAETTAIDTDTDYTMKLSFSGSNIGVDIDGENKISVIDSSLTTGSFGLAAYDQATFDDISVTDLGGPNTPSLSSPTDGDWTNDTTPTFSGNGVTDPEGTAVTYDLEFEDTDGSYDVTDIDGTSATPSSALPDGDYHWHIVAKDTSGNETPSASRTINIDTHAPVLTKSATTPAYINSTSPSFTFTSTESGTVNFSDCPANNLNTVTAGTESPNTLEFTDSLSEGAYDCTITTRDSASNAGFLNYSFTVDLTAPTLTITSPSDGLTTSSSSIVLSGTVTDVDPDAKLTINGVNIPSPGSFSPTGTLSIGTNIFIFVAKDTASNETTKTITVTRRVAAVNSTDDATVSSTPATATPVLPTPTTIVAPITENSNITIPSFVLVNPSDDSSTTVSEGSVVTFNTQTPILRGNTSPFASVFLEFLPGPFTAQVLADKDGNWEYKLTNPLAWGEHTIKITIKAQNTNETIAEGSYKINIAEKAEAKDVSDATDNGSNLWIWIIAVVVVLGGIIIVLKIRRNRR